MDKIIKKFLPGNKVPKVQFEGKLSYRKRLALRIFSTSFLGKIIWIIFRTVLLLGISYIILFPFFSKISSSFMSPNDFVDVTVKLIPKYPTLDQYRFIIIENEYFLALWNTASLSLMVAFMQTLICAFIGYGFAKFKFKGRGILFMAVIITMVVPHQTIMLSMFMKFRYFDLFGVFKGLNGLLDYAKTASASVKMLNPDGTFNFLNTNWPLIILSLTGLAFKNGLYIFIFRQFYKGVPDELEEAAYVDGSGIFKTYFRIILPLTVPIMVTIFMFAFSWQWTDNFYTSLFYTTSGAHMLPDIVVVPASLNMTFSANDLYTSAIINTASLLVILPLFIIFLFAQNALIEGVERSGIVG